MKQREKIGHGKRCLYLLLMLYGLCVVACKTTSRVLEDKDWCHLNCDPEINKENTEAVYGETEDDPFRIEPKDRPIIRFPLRFAFVQDSGSDLPDGIKGELMRVINHLNEAFEQTGFLFSLDQIEVIVSSIKLEELSENNYDLYDQFSREYDKADQITIFIFEHSQEFCIQTNLSISCSKTGGFSYILSSRTNNMVISRFDLNDLKILTHEMGHFFGLYHTFEERLFGKDTFGPGDCATKGDRICDTPPDPGTVYEVYVNYTNCEMMGLTDENGNAYKPKLDNYMSYYKPCYLRPYRFTEGQEKVMRRASQLDIRKRLSR